MGGEKCYPKMQCSMKSVALSFDAKTKMPLYIVCEEELGNATEIDLYLML